MRLRRLLLALAAAALALPALAQPAGTLKKIADSRSIALGYRADAVPFSYRGDDGRPATRSTFAGRWWRPSSGRLACSPSRSSGCR